MINNLENFVKIKELISILSEDELRVAVQYSFTHTITNFIKILAKECYRFSTEFQVWFVYKISYSFLRSIISNDAYQEILLKALKTNE